MKLAYAIAISILRNGIRPQPFLIPAYEMEKPKLFNRLNPAFQVMAAEDAGTRALEAAERAYHGDYRGAAISGLGAIGSGVGMAPGVVPQLVSIPLSFGADYLQEYFDEKDPHKSRASLKTQN